MDHQAHGDSGLIFRIARAEARHQVVNLNRPEREKRSDANVDTASDGQSKTLWRNTG